MSEMDAFWSNGPESVSKDHARRKYSVKLAAALRAGTSILGISQAAFARQMGISKSKLARAETAAGAISSEDLEFALNVFRYAGIKIDLTMKGDLHITLPDDHLNLLEAAMDTDAIKNIQRKDQISDPALATSLNADSKKGK